ncbi:MULTISPECIES: NYN domain-containing protein [unclassified Oceanispirochaeta]|uniref:NYN domain-containing protein n=1 Tax=unclassified Oceanispirochaeta TaxID=2635722 RepID=UPI000E097950|nr:MULTISPECIES: NYN domain-containing protein [unclassified Oceanispirochaeta]MBF9016195.1 NYN domain-containing protein [Oceanispirochaeta sp. M2]NPD72657.1 NYN domain-containing protein [Oceanispirochaeta sp. M1]RDG31807.1 NYN domain-containing protein [Oceanispirochaeta sp. M1]
MTENVAVLWDIENVTPKSSDSLLIQGMWDYAESLGRVVTSYAYADWSKPGFRSLGPTLSGLHFNMLHIPYQKTRKNKNGSDMQLVTDAMELLRYHEHITTFVLITGDSDFRSLLLSLRKSGKKIHIICDIKTAAQDLLILADSFADYRELMPDDDDSDDTESDDKESAKKDFPKEYWFERLAESAAILQKDKKSSNMGSAKINMKMLNRDFNEKKIGTRGYKRWSDFVSAAVRAGYVTLQDDDNQTLILPGKGYVQEVSSLQTALRTLVTTLEAQDGGKEPHFHSYSIISNELRDKGVVMKTLGFSQFKKFISSAEARGLVETKMENLRSYVKLQK